MLSQQHQPVLVQSVIDNLITNPSGIYIDGTFGRGGHSQAILQQLNKDGFLLALDKDPEAIAASAFLQKDSRFHIKQHSFAEIEKIAEQFDIVGKVDGVLLDLGVSSPQLDDPQRGFSFLKAGPLDMRMDPMHGISAATWLTQAREAEIAEVLKTYGEERFAKRIAHAIVQARSEKALTTTTELAAIIAKANPRWELHKHPATRSFQAIRIFINNELDALKQALPQIVNVLKIKGRLAVISFHSLEDRIVKRFIRQQQTSKIPKDIPLTLDQIPKQVQKIGTSIKPDLIEIQQNPRARSAILRIAEKV